LIMLASMMRMEVTQMLAPFLAISRLCAWIWSQEGSHDVGYMILDSIFKNLSIMKNRVRKRSHNYNYET
jgi:hypothetical protein